MPYTLSEHGRPITVYQYGERGSGFRPKGDVQDYQQIRKRCLEEGSLFEDPDFPAEDHSIFFSQSPNAPFDWKRPNEISDDPRFFVEGASRFDVVQGELGDCWLLAAVANLTMHNDLFYRVVPHDNSFREEYAGIFHFRFWQYGRWVDVVVDDRLPTYNGRLVFMHSKDNNEFWSALLEKAYAKLHGSYESLKGGSTCEAMEDFTGGVTEMFNLSEAPANLYKIMQKADERCSLMSCAIEPDPNVTEAQLENGLIRGHAYSITAVKTVEISTPRVTGRIPLLRIRNPWGNEAEWNGAWSDKSPEWQVTAEEERETLGLTFEADGEFWMSFKDFLNNFNRLEICNLSPDSLEDEMVNSKSKKKWEVNNFEGSWTRGCTAGGCRNFVETFWMNPQYRVVLEDVDEDDEEDKCTIIVGLMQKNHRRMRKMGAGDCKTIGFSLYQLDQPDSLPKPLPLDFFKTTASTARSPAFINLREVSGRFKLQPGTYAVLPSTFDPGDEADFLLRVFTEKKNEMSEYDEDIGISEPDEQVQEPVDEESQEKEDKIREHFASLAGEDLEIDCYELREILTVALQKDELPTTTGENKTLPGLLCMLCPCLKALEDDKKNNSDFDVPQGFSLDISRSMVAMMDTDRSGKLGLEEFKNLWQNVKVWKNVFRMYDKDSSGSLDSMELRSALLSAGYHVNTHILKALVLRYGNHGKITFDDFLMCAVKLRCMIESFQEKDPKKFGRATFSMEEWVEKTMYS